MRTSYRKGIRLIFRNRDFADFLNGNMNELGSVSRDPGKSYLFSLTIFDPGRDLIRDRVDRLIEHNSFGYVPVRH